MLLSVVFQDFKLFAMTLKENLALNNCENAKEKEIIEILEQVGLGDDFKKLTKGVETSVYKNFDDEGIEFSGGQSQKLAIARAIYKIAVFDNGAIIQCGRHDELILDADKRIMHG